MPDEANSTNQMMFGFAGADGAVNDEHLKLIDTYERSCNILVSVQKFSGIQYEEEWP